MSEIDEIQQQLADTKAFILRLAQAVASQPESSSLRVNLQTLLKRQRNLEEKLRKHQEAALPRTAPLEVGPQSNE